MVMTVSAFQLREGDLSSAIPIPNSFLFQNHRMSDGSASHYRHFTDNLDDSLVYRSANTLIIEEEPRPANWYVRCSHICRWITPTRKIREKSNFHLLRSRSVELRSSVRKLFARTA